MSGPPRIDIGRIARRRFGIERFRPGQEETIRAVLAGRDVLAVMPTGYGKSAVYQIPAVALPGPTVVISPLIALQRDQAGVLAGRDVGGAAVVNSAIGGGERRETFADLEDGALEFIFLAPEQLQREDVQAHLREARPSLWVVDEAHCISEWGHDFRPDYLQIGAAIEALGHPPVLALTATAAPQVREEILARLGMRDPLVLVRGFDRPNIRLGVETFSSEEKKRGRLIERVEAAEPPGIVYAATRRHTEELADALAERGIDAAAYHGGMPQRRRADAQAAFMDGDRAVMVATSAFGMGVDKPDVRFVFHYDISDSLDAYYQEIGRAGRDGGAALAVLLYRPEDTHLHKFFAGGGFVDAAALERVAEAVGALGETAEMGALAGRAGLGARKCLRALHLLRDVRGLDTTAAGGWRPAGPTGPAVAAAVQVQKRLHAQKLLRLERMRAYAEVRDCRRRYLLAYFGEDVPPCGRCDNCARGLPAARPAGAAQPFPVRTRVVHVRLGAGMVRAYDAGRIVVLFDEAGEKVLDLELVRRKRLLERL